MIITKEEFDKRLDAILIDYIVLYLQVEENPSVNRKPQQEAKQALRQLMLDVIGEDMSREDTDPSDITSGYIFQTVGDFMI